MFTYTGTQRRHGHYLWPCSRTLGHREDTVTGLWPCSRTLGHREDTVTGLWPCSRTLGHREDTVTISGHVHVHWDTEKNTVTISGHVHVHWDTEKTRSLSLAMFTYTGTQRRHGHYLWPCSRTLGHREDRVTCRKKDIGLLVVVVLTERSGQIDKYIP